ncbi:putative aldouronate transport system permease protein [Cohnella phaseoli]|uniref:Putative aldouronate transport system permease protein n=2 Tax=Cohnella phaseoli TaxID=456490 RepID=A0A3D9IUP1_9BACL|nr:putative aldouronate transport system permease protein [Cohnella phaseoli]
MVKASFGRKLFLGFDYSFMIVLALLCMFPLIHVLAVSFSSNSAASAGLVSLWPVGFNLKSYEFVLQKEEFLRSVGVSVQRVVLGSLIQMLLIVITAYPLSMEVTRFRLRTAYAWYFLITILFGGGLIPTYMVIKDMGMLDTIWALLIPSAVPVFSVVLLLNFYRGLPKELEEAAFIDGANHLRTLFSIILPLSLPAIATLLLFSMVGHWNAWFDGLLYMNRPENYPLQSYLQTLIINNDFKATTAEELQMLKSISNRSVKAAQIFLGALPILLVYPFLQKYFMKGIVLGSVKE